MNKKEWSVVIITILIFIGLGYFFQSYEEQLKRFIGDYMYAGMLAYTASAVISVLIAPINTFPLLILAATLWGPLVAALLSILGWTIGSTLAYMLAQKYGRMIVEKFISIKKAERICKAITGENPFWSIVVARMLIPVDALSYALGLFLKMNVWKYTLATFIGVSPFAFIFSYAATMSLPYMIGIGVLALVAIGVVYRRYSRFVK